MTEENHNPWAVPSWDSFNFLCCPECVYRSKQPESFQSHAVQNHPKSEAFFTSDNENGHSKGEILSEEKC